MIINQLLYKKNLLYLKFIYVIRMMHFAIAIVNDYAFMYKPDK